MWAVISVTSFWAVMAGARNIPLQEDWRVIRAAFGNQPREWEWLWTPNNEHLVPLPKFIYVSLLEIWPDFRVGMVFNLAVLGVLAAMFIVVSRRLRGHTRWTDAFFPLVLLHLGHWENLGWSWQIQFVSATALACALLMLVSVRAEPTPRWAVATGACVVAIPLTGATALPIAVITAGGLLPKARRTGGLVWQITLVAFVVTAAVTAIVAWGIEQPEWVLPSPGLLSSAVSAAKVMGMALGPAAGAWWFVAFLVVAAAVVVAALQSRRSPSGLPLLAFLLGGAALAAGVGHGRAGLVEFYGFPDRYAIAMVPVLCAVYLAYERFGTTRWRRLGPVVLCVLIAVLLPLNTAFGIDYRDWYHGRVDTFAADLEAGVPLDELSFYRPIAPEAAEMKAAMVLLKGAGVGVFSGLREERSSRRERRIDDLDTPSPPWEKVIDTRGGSSSTARLQGSAPGVSLRWGYQVRDTAAAVGRGFRPAADWRGFGAIALRLRGEGKGTVFRVRLSVGTGGNRGSYDSIFVDDVRGVRTVVLPWNAFGHVDSDGHFDWEGPLPLDRVEGLLLVAESRRSGTLIVEQVSLLEGHPQIGWPFHPAATRRSLPPWR